MKGVISVFQQQLVHVQNGYISDNPECLMYVKVGTIDYHSTGHHLGHYQSLHGTSKVEAVHSVLDHTFYSQRGIGMEVLIQNWDGGLLVIIDGVCEPLVRSFHQTAYHPRYMYN